MNNIHLETFIRIVEAGSFNAVIKQVNLLENDVGVQLFEKNVLLVVKSWNCVHLMLKVIPVEWDHSIPFGVLYSIHPSDTVKWFLEAVKTVIE